jgi:hypothetical protein
MSLTKSLHTVTAVVQVAHHVHDDDQELSRRECVDRALAILGYNSKGMKNDPTYIACIKKFNASTI